MSRRLGRIFRSTVVEPVWPSVSQLLAPDYYRLSLTLILELVQTFGTKDDHLVLLKIVEDVAHRSTGEVLAWRWDGPFFSACQEVNRARASLRRLAQWGLLRAFPSLSETRYGLPPALEVIWPSIWQKVTERLQQKHENVSSFCFACRLHVRTVGEEVIPRLNALTYVQAARQNFTCTDCHTPLDVTRDLSSGWLDPPSESDDDTVPWPAESPRVTLEGFTLVRAHSDDSDAEDSEDDDPRTPLPPPVIPQSPTPGWRVWEARNLSLDRAHAVLQQYLTDVWQPLLDQLRLLAAEPLPPLLSSPTPGLPLPSGVTRVIRLREQPFRPYQTRAATAVVDGAARSGVVVMPCGAGKTLTALLCLHRLSQLSHSHDRVLVVCNSHASMRQWQLELYRYTSLWGADVVMLRSPVTLEQVQKAQVVLVTYTMLTKDKLSDTNQRIRQQLRAAPFMAHIFDEVHQIPAETFCRSVTAHTGAVTLRLGLTATLKGETNASHIQNLIGPVLFECKVTELVRAQFVAKVNITFVSCPTHVDVTWPSLSASAKLQMLGWFPGVLVSTLRLLQVFKSQHSARILVFSNHLRPLTMVEQLISRHLPSLGVTKVTGATPMDQRERLFRTFEKGIGAKVLLLSKIGDMALNIPNANYSVDLSWTPGSKPQPVQRAGRLQRRKTHGDHTAQCFIMVPQDDVVLPHAEAMFAHMQDKEFEPDWADSLVDSTEVCRSLIPTHVWSKIGAKFHELASKKRKH